MRERGSELVTRVGIVVVLCCMVDTRNEVGDDVGAAAGD